MNARSWWLMMSVGLGIMLNPLNSSMVSVAIPRLQEDFRLNYTVVSWIIFSFYIASAIAQPVLGRASDLFGRRKIFLAGLLVSFLASLFAPLSPSFGWLVVFRVVQSIGTSMIVAVGMAIVRIHMTEKQATALSILSIFLSGAAAIGPFVGGLLIHWWDWHAIFLVNIPFVIASSILAWKVIPKDEASSTQGLVKNIDIPGILLFAMGLVGLLYGLLSINSSHGHLGMDAMIGLAGLLMLILFVRHELRTTTPFIPLRVFAQYPALTWVNIQFIVVNLLFYSLFFGIPSYLQLVRQISDYHTGILMLSLGLCSVAVSPIAGRWIERSGPRPALITAACLMAIGSIWLVTLNESSPVVSVCLALAAFGISNGLNSVGMQAALFQSSPKEMAGVAAGLFNTSRYMGTILSSLLIGIIMGNAFSFEGFRILGVMLTIIAIGLVLMNWRFKESTQRQVN
ncbi:MFS transporter [Paenibacillus glycanilyticus]|uniref:MFS transporter n=1 Tax=Paenibacillus glycanilyticus TaxID=126569 RepID=A0ABQ6GJZ5_9BACL|nr:MFS transporter [Paenibacillus glycanilyticus]GLX70553.1 MFS transporter [Paenibacillus glycanilyticus]